MAKSFVTRLLAAQSADVVGVASDITVVGIRGMYALCQVSGIGSADVKILGRLAPEHSWHVITTFSVNEAREIVLFPEMRADIENWATGTIYCDVMAGNK